MPLKKMRGETRPDDDTDDDEGEVEVEEAASRGRPMRPYSERGVRMAKTPRPMQAVPTR